MLRFVLMCLVVFVSACTQHETIEVPYKKAKVSTADSFPQQFIAGAQTVDITPPPGSLPRAGYATWSTIGEGFRTRLYSRVYYLRDGQGDSHLIVQTDLTSGSRIFHTRLGEYLAASTDIDASNITITSTHSHSAPGQIVGSQFYNKHISHVSGFARDYFDFLIERIGEASKQAIASAKPAALATGDLDIWGLTRNRSIQAYVENKNITNKRISDNRTFHNVNPTMHMIRIDQLSDDGSLKPLGAFASFSIHGTGLPERETLYNADVWAYIHKDWESAILKSFRDTDEVHVSAFEGTHGDVAPASRFGMLGYIEARRIGKSIAKETVNLYDSLSDRLTTEIDIQSAIRYVNIREENRIEDVSICNEAAAGMTLAAAPLEHTSPVIGYLPFFKQGSRRWGDEEGNCQGRKRILGFSWGQPLLEPKDSFPDYVHFQLLRINDFVLAPYPFELTVESGRRLEGDIKQAFGEQGKAIDHIMVSSLSGGYTGYVTTPEEYGRQYYEGGHTIYGKYTLPYLRAHSRKLASELASTEINIKELPSNWTYTFEVKDFLPKEFAIKGSREVVVEPSFRHAQMNSEGRWSFVWRDAAPGKMEFHNPLLSIQTKKVGDSNWDDLSIDQVQVNDQMYDMGVRLLEVSEEQGMATYEGYWFNPLFRGEAYEYRFVVEPRAGFETLYSPSFN